ncbi:MAG: leucyl aminopeptidase [Halieaceae bacterium]
MDIKATSIANAGSHKSACAVVPVFTRKRLSKAAQQLDKATAGLVTAALKSGEIQGNPGESLMLHTGKDKGASRILLLGAGNPGKLDAVSARKLVAALVLSLKSSKAKDAVVHIEELASDQVSLTELCRKLSRAAVYASYSYSETVSKPKPGLGLNKLVVNGGSKLKTTAANAALRQGQHMGAGVNVARELANLPGNICTPTYLARQAKKLASDNSKLTTRILEEKQMRELGMGSLLSVGNGSAEKSKLIVMQYKGAAAAAKPYVLVGKGITFDSGGISLKPGAKMDEMKFDMGGAASVFGTMHTLLAMKLPINVVAIVAAAENMPSGTATKPGDVVTSMSGQTIEVLNTDAEGRLVLCDALTYAERFKPAAVIDIATLTGACVVALGSHASGMYANNDKLAEQLTQAGERSFDRAWRMPLWDEYQKQIDTPFADMANVGGPAAGSITAACFLARYTGKYPWAHLDIAGSAWNSAPKGATGRPVSLLSSYLMDRAGIKQP